jgi:hypothetical protein
MPQHIYSSQDEKDQLKIEPGDRELRQSLTWLAIIS